MCNHDVVDKDNIPMLHTCYEIIKNELGKPTPNHFMNSEALPGDSRLKKNRGRPKIPKDFSHSTLRDYMIPEMAKLLGKITMERSGKNKRRRPDQVFNQIMIYIKKIPHFLGKCLFTGKYYKTSYKQSRRKTIVQFMEAFRGFMTFISGVDYSPCKLFLDFIVIYYTDRKVMGILTDLRDEGSITEKKYEDLKFFVNKRRGQSKELNMILLSHNQALRICLWITSMILEEFRRPAEKILLVREQLNQLQVELQIKQEFDFEDS